MSEKHLCGAFCDALYVHKCVVRVSVVGKFISRPTEAGPNPQKNVFTNGQTVKNSNFLSSNCCVPNLWMRMMATNAASFSARYRTSILFEDRLYSRSLQFLRTVLLISVELVGFEEWFYIPAGSLPNSRRVTSCILFLHE